MIKKFASLTIAGLIVIFTATVSTADAPTNEDLLKELRDMRKIIDKQNARIDQLEKQIKAGHADLEGKVETLKNVQVPLNQDVSVKRRHEVEQMTETIGGLEIGAEATAIGQGTPNANNTGATDGKKARFDGSYSVDIVFAKSFADLGGRAFVHLEAGQGQTIQNDIAVFSNVNGDAGPSRARVDVTEAWYRQYLFDEQVAITGGKIDPTAHIDTNEYANDENTQFLGEMFINSDVIDWPEDNSFGLRAYLSPKILMNSVGLEFVYMDANGDWENLFDNPFIATQLNFAPAKIFDYNEEEWGGNYRVIYWYNGRPHELIKESGVIKRGNFGFGLSFDQKVTQEYGVFGRVGWSDPRKSVLGMEWSTGGQMTGKHWGREQDILAIGVGQAIPGRDYRNTNVFHSPETHLEAYYAWELNKHLILTPDAQVIWDPNGGGVNGNKNRGAIFVYGIRGHLDF